VCHLKEDTNVSVIADEAMYVMVGNIKRFRTNAKDGLVYVYIISFNGLLLPNVLC